MSKNPTYRLDAETFYDHKTDEWVGNVSVVEFRQGRQYGGAAVYTFRSNKPHSRFMAEVRKLIGKATSTCVT